jgi:hypothetical protein
VGARCDVTGRGLRGLVGPGERAGLTDGDDEGEEGEAEEDVRRLHREGEKGGVLGEERASDGRGGSEATSDDDLSWLGSFLKLGPPVQLGGLAG